MSSASAIPPVHVPCATEWPALSPPKNSSQDHPGTDSDWEFLPEPDGDLAQTSFEREAIRVAEPVEREIAGVNTKTRDPTEVTSHYLKHAQSTPDFRHYNTIIEEDDNDGEGVLIGTYREDDNEDGVGSLASSSIIMVSGPPSVISSESCWSATSKISFRDAIMKQQSRGLLDHNMSDKETQELARQPKTVRKKPKFVVKPIRRCSKSTGDLQSLARIVENSDHHGDDDFYNNELILGDTDAELYYNQKAQGKLGRKNGRKMRPDEAKRLQMTMAKKDDQRQRQQRAASKKG